MQTNAQAQPERNIYTYAFAQGQQVVHPRRYRRPAFNIAQGSHYDLQSDMRHALHKGASLWKPQRDDDA